MKNKSPLSEHSYLINGITMAPVLVFACLVPFVMRLRVVFLTPSAIDQWIHPSTNSDFYAYYKMLIILFCGLLSLLIFLFFYLKHRVVFKHKLFLCFALLYGVSILIASTFSSYTDIAFFGGPDRYEGLYTLLSYLMLFMYFLLFIDTPKKIRFFSHALLVSFTLMLLWGTLEFFNLHPFSIPLLQQLVGISSDTAARITTDHRSVMSLYNTNYAGQYVSLVVFFILAHYAKARSLGKRIWLIVLSYLAFMTLLGTSAFAAYGAILFTFILFVFFFRRNIKAHHRSWLAWVISLVILIGITHFATHGLVGSRLGILSLTHEAEKQIQRDLRIQVEDIRIQGDLIHIQNSHQSFYIGYDEHTFSFYDEEKQPLPTEANDNDRIIIPLEKYEPLSFLFYDAPTISVFIDRSRFTLHRFVDHFQVVGYLYKPFDVVDVPSVHLLPDTFFSGRGILYNRIIPIIAGSPLIGHGPDTTLLTYPQHDVLGKINVFRNATVVINKPHSLYLQIAHDSGLIGLLIFLSLLGLFFIKNLKIIWKGDHLLLTGIWLSLFSYAIASICYDSTVHVSPIFWMLLALGVVLSHLAKSNGQHHTNDATDHQVGDHIKPNS